LKHSESAILQRAGFTLLEIIVVLILLAMATAVVGPSLFYSKPVTSQLPSVLATAREVGIKRGETVRLRIDVTGAWQLTADATAQEDLLLSGRITDPMGSPVDLVISPLGTCGHSSGSSLPPGFPPLDALNCELLSR
jgi:prepilin-type N-terminal cleavage/methylation domain-containing protein